MKTFFLQLTLVILATCTISLLFSQSCLSPTIVGTRTTCSGKDLNLSATGCTATVLWYTKNPATNPNIKPFDMGANIVVSKAGTSSTIYARCENSTCKSDAASFAINVLAKSTKSNALFSYGANTVCQASGILSPIKKNANTLLGRFICGDSTNISIDVDGNINTLKSKAGVYYISNVVEINECLTLRHLERIRIKACTPTEVCPTAQFKLISKVYDLSDSTSYRPIMDSTARAGEWSITAKMPLNLDGSFTPSQLAVGKYLLTNTLAASKTCKKQSYSDTIQIVESRTKGPGITAEIAATSSPSSYLPSVTPPSPNAASLGKYGDMPVNFYTGQPSTSIPLYTINSGDIVVPISLSYHHGGIRVEEEASNVGLGWALNTGGVITRTIRNLDDLRSKGIPFKPLASNPETDPYVKANITDSGWGFPGIDTEPDIFYYNIGGESGKFILETSTGFPLKGITLNKSDVSITCSLVSGATTPPAYGTLPKYRWVIKLSNGIIYTFEEQEVAVTVYGPGGSPQGYENSDYSTMPALGYNSMRNGQLITSWYLSKINSPNTQDEVIFNYDQTSAYYSTSRLAANEVYFNSGVEPQADGNCMSPYTLIPKAGGFNYSATITRNAYLKSIVFDKGASSVNFSLSDREDIQQYVFGANSPTAIYLGNIDDRSYPNLPKKPQKVDAISVLSGSTEVKVWQLTYSYFNSNVVDMVQNPTATQINKKFNNLRLRLDGLREKENSGANTLPGYKFSYSGDVVNSSGQVTSPVVLPSKTSWAKDYWGYYNGKVANNSTINTHIIPKLVYPKMYGSKDLFTLEYKFVLMGFGNTLDIGIDREVDPNYATYGTLQAVIYPTGGNTQFEYESHKAWGGAGDVERITLSSYGNNQSSILTVPPYTGDVQYMADIKYTLSCSTPPNSGGTVCGPSGVNDTNSNTWYAKITSTANPNFRLRTYLDWVYRTCTYCNRVIEEQGIPMPTGNYQVFTNAPSSAFLPIPSVTLTLNKYYPTDYKEVAVGGLRIAKITDKDNANIAKTKVFVYTKESGSTSGKQMRPAIKFITGYKEQLRIQEEASVFMNNGMWTPNCVNKYWAVEMNAYSLSPLGNSASGSAIGYDRVVVQEQGMNNGKTVYEYINQADEVPSSVLFPDIPTTQYLGNGMLTKEIYYNAAGNKVKEVLYEPTLKPNTTTFYTGMKCLMGGNLNTSGLQLAKVYYKVKAEFWYNASTTEKTYFENNSTTVINRSYYTASNHYQITKRENIDAKANTLATIYSYPKDMVALNKDPNGIYAGMVSNNIVSPVIEETTTNASVQTSYKITSYKKWNNVFYAPETIKTQIATTDPLRTEVTFNSYSTSGKPLSYTDKGGLTTTMTWWNDSDITKYNFLKTKTVNALTTSYDYWPLIGLKSIVDPSGKTTSFVYDSFGRLTASKDLDNNYLSATSYHYTASSTYVPNCTVAAPIISIGSNTTCSSTLSASNCSGTVLWSNGMTGSNISLPSQVTQNITALCSSNGCNSTASNEVVFPVLPTGWKTQDVGRPVTGGCTQYNNPTLTLNGSGLVWGNTDTFHWVYKNYSGDITLITKISSMPAIDGRRSGIMIRTSNAPDAPFFEIILDGNGNVGKLKRRDIAGSVEFVGYAPSPVGQTWLKLEKIGNQLKVYYKNDTQTSWNDFGWDNPTENNNIGSNFLIGLTVRDNNGATNVTSFTNTTINGLAF